MREGDRQTDRDREGGIGETEGGSLGGRESMSKWLQGGGRDDTNRRIHVVYVSIMSVYQRLCRHSYLPLVFAISVVVSLGR